jgi:hypothetical protein
MRLDAGVILAAIFLMFAVLVGLPDAIAWVRRKVDAWRRR